MANQPDTTPAGQDRAPGSDDPAADDRLPEDTAALVDLTDAAAKVRAASDASAAAPTPGHPDAVVRAAHGKPTPGEARARANLDEDPPA